MIRGALVITGPKHPFEVQLTGADLRRPVRLSRGGPVELAPGIYDVTARVAARTRRTTVAVWPEREAWVDLSDMAPDTVTPIYASVRDRHQADAAARLSRKPLVPLPHAEGRLMFFTWRVHDAPRTRRPKLWLLRPEGDAVLRLHDDGVVNPLHGCAGFCLDLPAGPYVLAEHVPGHGLRGQAVAVAPGMETHVFALWVADHPELSRAAVSLLPLGTGFDPSSTARYVALETELAALAHEQCISDFDIAEPLEAEAAPQDPITQLAYAYRMLRTAEINRDAIARAVNAVARWAPADAAALRTASGMSDDIGDLPGGAPPLFAIGRDLLAMNRRFTPDSVGRATDGSIWSRWQLTSSTGMALPDDLQGQRRRDDRDGAADRMVSRAVLLRPIGGEIDWTAAASAPEQGSSAGRHFDFRVLPQGSSHAGRTAEIRVRRGRGDLLYRRSGELELTYGPTGQPVPHHPPGIPITAEAGIDLRSHLEQNLRIGGSS